MCCVYSVFLCVCIYKPSTDGKNGKPFNLTPVFVLLLLYCALLLLLSFRTDQNRPSEKEESREVKKEKERKKERERERAK